MFLCDILYISGQCNRCSAELELRGKQSNQSFLSFVKQDAAVDARSQRVLFALSYHAGHFPLNVIFSSSFLLIRAVPGLSSAFVCFCLHFSFCRETLSKTAIMSDRSIDGANVDLGRI